MPQTSQRPTNFVPVTDSQELDDLIARSHTAPVLIFKHSTTCPISAHAHREMAQVSGDVMSEVPIVVVQSAREVSRLVAEQTGIRHESPQAIVLRNGAVVWSASHFDITTEAVEQAVEGNR